MMTEYSPLELMTVVLARELRDGEVGSAGISAMVPMAAMFLARELHAPNLVIGGERLYNPRAGTLQRGFADARSMAGAEAIEGYWELFGHWHHGLDFFFYSGLQIDQYGNLNLHYVGGTFDRPRFRGPGVPNVSLASTCRRLYLYPTDHTPKRFVERVDFISVPGHLQGPQSKAAAGLRHAGPVLCVTPIAVLDFAPDCLRMRLKSVHPGVTAADVQSRTGFELVIPPEVGTTPTPTSQELEVLRTVVDPHGMLRKARVAA